MNTEGPGLAMLRPDRAAAGDARPVRRGVAPGRPAGPGAAGNGARTRRRVVTGPLSSGPALSGPPPGRAPRELLTWVRVQGQNTRRHVEALRPFTRAEFGSGPEMPTEGHLRGANELISMLTRQLDQRSRRLDQAVRTAINVPNGRNLQHVVRRKQSAHEGTLLAERVWDFYFELFGQRQSRFGPWLLACDRIALDCYQYAYLGLGTARSIPAPPAFSYMRTGFSPATFRRGIPLRRLGRQLNPFPLIQLPYHRLVNPWTLGAILHEVSHNLQNDLGLAQAVPREIGRQLLAAGIPPDVAAVWVRWNRETFADLAGLQLGGPAVVASLMDVVGRSPEFVVQYVPGGVHPVPFLRVLFNVEQLQRMGFPDEARLFRSIWLRTYPPPTPHTVPEAVLRTFEPACAVVLRAVCDTAFSSLGGRTLSQVLRFEPKEQHMIEETARRLATGDDPGVVPERFLIGAARFALDRRLAEPQQLTDAFFRELARR
jgi:hypothetical protein